MLEKYDYFIRSSSAGRACTYATKSRELFMAFDWAEVRPLVLKLLEAARELEGVDFGKQ